MNTDSRPLESSQLLRKAIIHTNEHFTDNQINFLLVVNVGFPVLPLFKTISF